MKTWWPGSELNRRRQPFQGFSQPISLIGQQLNLSRWSQFCDHPVTSADVRLSVGQECSSQFAHESTQDALPWHVVPEARHQDVRQGSQTGAIRFRGGVVCRDQPGGLSSRLPVTHGDGRCPLPRLSPPSGFDFAAFVDHMPLDVFYFVNHATHSRTPSGKMISKILRSCLPFV